MASGTRVGKVYLALHNEQHLPNIKWMLHSHSSDILMNGTSEIHHALLMLKGRGMDALGKEVRPGQKSAASSLPVQSEDTTTLNRPGENSEDVFGRPVTKTRQTS